MPITWSIGELADTWDYQPQYQLILVYREIFCTDTLWNTRIVTNINDKHANSQIKPENFQRLCKFPVDFQDFQVEKIIPVDFQDFHEC